MYCVIIAKISIQFACCKGNVTQEKMWEWLELGHPILILTATPPEHWRRARPPLKKASDGWKSSQYPVAATVKLSLLNFLYFCWHFFQWTCTFALQSNRLSSLNLKKKMYKLSRWGVAKVINIYCSLPGTGTGIPSTVPERQPVV